MKANELMIGDWVSVDVCCIPTPCVKVTAIGDDYVQVYDTERELAIEEICPICLTPEILEKNGIKYQYGNPWYQGGDEDGIEIHFALYCQMKLQYVHQLQHALRLCEINKEIKL